MTRLHIGCGPVALPGWINIDNQPYPAVDRVLDVTTGLPFDDVSFIFAEHFIEHLSYQDGLKLLRSCRRVMNRTGVLRLSTPNLDWVWSTHYHFPHWSSADEPLRACFALNQAFRGWGHQFLYNMQTLQATLREAGFGKFVICRYGESSHPELQNLEKHETYVDVPELPHILVIEASGFFGEKQPDLESMMAGYQEAVGVR
ncbi:MAG TPA: hypothetical protein VHL58_07545 [Thermoanaerobaculia bacterium]|nr:hypothetical protein [Thermoanaerobaculia bacterium]